MDRTFLQFGDKYYRYTGAGTDDDPGLTIGGFESAWLADLGLSFLFQEIPSIVRAMKFLEVYRDDGLAFFDGAVDKQYITPRIGTCLNIRDRLKLFIVHNMVLRTFVPCTQV